MMSLRTRLLKTAAVTCATLALTACQSGADSKAGPKASLPGTPPSATSLVAPAGEGKSAAEEAAADPGALLTGTTAARRTSQVSASGSGLLVELKVREGDVVKAGEVSAVLDRRDAAEARAAAAERILGEAVAAAEALRARGRPRVLYVRGPRGLETGVAGSINTEIIEFAGAENVAASALGAGSLVQFSMEQVFAWNPDWIIAIHPDFMTTAKTDRLWSAVPAVRAGRVALAPGLPFGWVDFPPAVNRLLGLIWLPVLFGLRPRAGLVEAVAAFHALFYHRRPEPAQIEALLRPALPLPA